MANVNSTSNAKLAAPLGNVTAATVFQTQDSVTANAASSSAPLKAAVVYLDEYQVDNFNLQSATKFPLTSRVYALNISGRVSAGTSGTFGVAVQIGSSTTAASNTTLFTATAQTYNLLGDFVVQATLVYDPTAKVLTGTMSSNGGSTPTLQALAAINPGQSIDLSLGKQPLCATGVFGTSNASNAAWLDSFTLGVVG